MYEKLNDYTACDAISLQKIPEEVPHLIQQIDPNELKTISQEYLSFKREN